MDTMHDAQAVAIISIHALREEGDDCTALLLVGAGNISIHALREEGDKSLAWAINNRLLFLSTPSARRATSPQRPTRQRAQISIHALREEGDRRAKP